MCWFRQNRRLLFLTNTPTRHTRPPLSIPRITSHHIASHHITAHHIATSLWQLRGARLTLPGLPKLVPQCGHESSEAQTRCQNVLWQLCGARLPLSGLPRWSHSAVVICKHLCPTICHLPARWALGRVCRRCLQPSGVHVVFNFLRFATSK